MIETICQLIDQSFLSVYKQDLWIFNQKKKYNIIRRERESDSRLCL